MGTAKVIIPISSSLRVLCLSVAHAVHSKLRYLSVAQFLSDKYLKYRKAIEGRQIEPDLSCDRCGYNLRGLRYGGRCPECGLPIQLPDWSRDSLSAAPIADIRKLRLGIWATVACLPALPLGLVTSAMRLGGATELAIVTIGLSCAWFGAV